jgi:FMN-dependent oxidoreductase (nitrilotriacetate monooxygenase family)
MTKRRMLLNAFTMNCVVHQSPGLWVREDNRAVDYKDLNVWVDLAKLLERGKFDALFLADVVGVYDVFNGGREAAARTATQLPVNDPMLLIPAMAHATEHLGFGFTSGILQYPPYTFARLISTLDFITNGRVAWNIVTSYLESAGRAYGLEGLADHDERYDMADEYCEVVYKLWEASWADDAVVKDSKRGIYADPNKILDVNHSGKYYTVNGCHLTEPSPQRTPILFQAGASPRGRAFAAKHAECAFFLGPNAKVDGDYIADVRKRTAAAGRDPNDILAYAYMKIVTGGTEAEAWRKYDEYYGQISYDSAMTLMSGWSGLDFGSLDPDMKIEYVETNAMRTMLQGFAEADPDKEWTVRDVANYAGIGGAGPVLVGSEEQIADQLEEWVDHGIDGFNIAYGVTPGSFEDFVDGVVPVLQKRERVQTEYSEGTLREKLYGPGRSRLSAPHPAAQIRDAVWGATRK